MRVLLSIILAGCLPVLSPSEAAATLESLLAQAREAQTRGDYRAAADDYWKAVSIRRDLPELWSNLGLMQYESQEYSQAEKALRQALAIDESLFVPNLFLGLDLLELKRAHEAAGYLLAARKSKPQDSQVLLGLGRALHDLFEPERSRMWYQRAADVDPRNGEAWFGLGVADLDLAEAASRKLTQDFAQSPYVAELTAETLADQGRLPEAVERYRLLLASGCELPPCARTSYGFVLLLSRDRAQAEEQFRRDQSSCPAAKAGESRLSSEATGSDTLQTVVPAAPELLPPALKTMNERQLERMAAATFFSGDFLTTRRIADRLKERFPNQAQGWYWAVRADQKLGVAALARAGEVAPESPRMRALLGDAYQRRKMFHEAEAEYSKMLALEPGSVAAMAGLTAAYLAAGQLEIAKATARKALDQYPADSEINLLMAEILVVERKYAEAAPYLEQSRQVRPDLLPRVHALLGRLYARTGRPQEAITELTQGLASDEDGSVHYQLARLFQSSGDSKAAAAAFRKSQQIRAKRNVPADTTAPDSVNY